MTRRDDADPAPSQPSPPSKLEAGGTFTPLRSDPPPHLFATWWLRYLLVLSQLVGIVVVLLREYAVAGGTGALFVVIPHVLAVVMLVGWSALAMLDAARLVPGTRYGRAARAWVAVALWLGGLASLGVAAIVVGHVRNRFAMNGEDLGAISIGTGAVLGCFIAVWLPFRYHVLQAQRIGAPVRVVAAWFWLPLLALVGAFVVTALGVHDRFAADGFDDLERALQLGVLYGVPALVFAVSTWRATTVFDEVIELRWTRWRTEWEQTLAAFVSQPPPGPEASPDPISPAP